MRLALLLLQVLAGQSNAPAAKQLGGTTLLYGGIRYETAVTRNDFECRGLLYAIDAASGLPMWSTTVYALPRVRGPGGVDADVFITRLWFEGPTLMVENQRGERYAINSHTHGATRALQDGGR